MIGSYGKVWNLGHSAVKDLLPGEVLVQEKIDGSQFSFRKGEDGVVEFRSKQVEVTPESGSMFDNGCRAILEVANRLQVGWVYRGEYLKTVRHNVLKYDRLPQRHVVLFDIDTGLEEYAPPRLVIEHAQHIGVDYAPVFFAGEVKTSSEVLAFLERESVLGGPKVEGVVLKGYGKFGPDGHTLMGKYVSSEFRELHSEGKPNFNPGKGNIVQTLIDGLKSERRWDKSIERARDAGTLTDSLKDIGPLIQSVNADVEVECKEEIMEALFAWCWGDIRRGITNGFPEFYKKRLLEKQFATNEGETE